MLRQPVLENFHERLLFFYGQVGGGIQDLRKLCHGRNLASGPILGSPVFLQNHTDASARRRKIFGDRKLPSLVLLAREEERF